MSMIQIWRDIHDAVVRKDYGKLGICADMLDDLAEDLFYEPLSFALRWIVRHELFPSMRSGNRFCWWGYKGRPLKDGTDGQLPFYIAAFQYYPTTYHPDGYHKVICFEDYQPIHIHLLALADALHQVRAVGNLLSTEE